MIVRLVVSSFFFSFRFIRFCCRVLDIGSSWFWVGFTRFSVVVWVFSRVSLSLLGRRFCFMVV